MRIVRLRSFMARDRNRPRVVVAIDTDEGITGWGECFGPGTVALANRTIVEKVIAPMVLGDFAIEPQHEYVSRYRFLIHDGAADREFLEAAWKQYEATDPKE